jgi:hypothetical protein
MQQALFDTYKEPQNGEGFNVFAGDRRHMAGGSFLGTIARFAIPILKFFGKHAISAASRGAGEYLAGNKPFIPAMTDELAQEIPTMVNAGYNAFKNRRKKQAGRGKRKKKMYINKVEKSSNVFKKIQIK